MKFKQKALKNLKKNERKINSSECKRTKIEYKKQKWEQTKIPKFKYETKFELKRGLK